MHVVLASMFRTMAGSRLERYLQQAAALQAALAARGHSLVCLWAEGDSTDDTRARLLLAAADLRAAVVDVTHGQRVFGSTEEPERLAALSRIGNRVLDCIGDRVDVVFWVESDLLWDAETAVALIQRTHGTHTMTAPLVFAGDAFYDLWGFRGLDGARFGPWPPYHPDVATRTAPVEVSSVGSCFALQGPFARLCRIHDDYGWVGLCASVRAAGGRIWVDPTLRIDHPC